MPCRRKQKAVVHMAGIASNNPDNVVKSDSLALTRYAGVGAAILVVLNAINPAADKLLGGHPSAAVRVSLFIAIIAAWALIAATDILARAYATAHVTEPPPSVGYTIAPLAPPLRAVSVEGRDSAGFLAVAVRFKGDEDLEFMLVKPGQAPIWLAARNVELG